MSPLFFFPRRWNRCVIPLLHTRINFQQIINSIPDLVRFSQSNGNNGKEFFDDNFFSIISDSITQLEKIRTSNNSSKNSNVSLQLEIFFITNQPQSHVEKVIARMIKDNKIDTIKKVQVVRVNCSERDVRGSQDSSGSTDSSTSEVLCGYVESVYIENNKLSFDQFFRNWLQDGGTDDVHLTIQFGEFSLKCDLIDTIIDPINMSAASNFTLETEVTYRIPLPPSVKNRQKSSINIYNLVPKNLIPITGVCESLLYGVPLIVKPTSCWKLDWEELEKNQGFFHSVNSYLTEKSLAVLLCTHQDTGPIYSYYLLLPSQGTSMLIKSIATQDILMPRDACSNSNNLSVKSGDIDEQVCEQMEKINLATVYNPFQYNCNLFRSNALIPANNLGTGKVVSTAAFNTKENIKPRQKKGFCISSSYQTKQPSTAFLQQQVTFGSSGSKNRIQNDRNDYNRKKMSAWRSSSTLDDVSTDIDAWSNKKKKARFEPPKTLAKNP